MLRLALGERRSWRFQLDYLDFALLFQIRETQLFVISAQQIKYNTVNGQKKERRVVRVVFFLKLEKETDDEMTRFSAFL